MIKRDGVEVASPHSKNAKIAKETISICKNKKYTSLNGSEIDFSQVIDYAIENTFYYESDSLIGILPYQNDIQTIIEVTNETTSQAAVRLFREGKSDLVALNFAAARNPGGGFLAGAVAQEEDLCRSSALYSCIKRKPLYYNANIMCDDTYYTNGIIYSPKVPFFRNEYNLLIEEFYLLSIISSPAPNVRAMDIIDNKLLLRTLHQRAERILQVANARGHKNIILGAWGCGAFGNDPNIVADVFKSALLHVPYFEHVCFAVYDNREPPVIFETFKQVYENNHTV